jgi:DNA mismatch endonuclease Vsr
MSPSPSAAAPLQAIDLFCGAGGLTEGFKQAGFDVPFALDRDADSCESYAANHKGTHVEHASITDLSPDVIAAKSGEVDVVVGGPSCQGFSTARKDRWNDPDKDHNLLWTHMLAVVERLRPRAFLIENVPGLVYWKDGGFGAAILQGFRNLGYAVTEPRILLAADYGVPQRRRRLFIIGLKGDRIFGFPPPTHLGGWRRDTLHLWERRRQELGLLRHLTCWEAIGDLPPIGEGTGAPRMAYPDVRPTPFIRRIRGGATVLRDHEISTIGEEHRRLIEHVPQGGTWRDIPPHLLPDRFRGMRRTDSSNLLGRLDPALSAYTITTQFDNVTTGCFTHPYEDRALSVREGARLQTFPDRYRFVGSVDSRCRQVGNAVPPMLAAILADAIAEQIEAPGRGTRWRPKPVKPAAQLPPPPTTATTAARMRRQKRADTAPEVLLRTALDQFHMVYETDSKPIPGLRRSADVVIPSAQVAVFLDGCFWHGCPDHSRATKSNTRWWAEKIAANKQRDSDTNSRLEAGGWRVVRIWEHEDPATAAKRVAAIVREGQLLFPKASSTLPPNTVEHSSDVEATKMRALLPMASRSMLKP